MPGATIVSVTNATPPHHRFIPENTDYWRGVDSEPYGSAVVA
jgi:hypothetical protein